MISALIPLHVPKVLNMARPHQVNLNMYGRDGAKKMGHRMTHARMNNGEEKGIIVGTVVREVIGNGGKDGGTPNEYCVEWLLSLRCRYH